MPPQRQSWEVDGKFLQLNGERSWLRGITYGPFNSGGAPHGLPSPDRYYRDLDLIAAMGANTLRLTRSPTHEFLTACAERDLQTLIGLTWEDFVDFLHEPTRAARIVRSARRTFSEFSEAPAVAGFFVGNEINAQMVRWLGRERVKKFLEQLIDAGRACHSTALFAYASYPTTEYLMPDNADFVAYNVYLERRADFARYLQRLQHLSGNRPLVISEFGIDTAQNGEEFQREVLGWACEEMAEQGVAGTILFTFTDEWFTGGREMSEWRFGIVDRERLPKPAYNAVQERFNKGVAPLTALTRVPHISVIVCTHDGQRTLEDCLRSLSQLNYPDYEVLVIDDGSTEDIKDIVKKHADVRYVRQEHAGLSVARNLGAKVAHGEILAYTDDDCMPDKDWLGYIALAFQRNPDTAAIGGPNLPPPPKSMPEACVNAAPGSPSHVMLTDFEAEHIPGCNLAVRRQAFELIDGFRGHYLVAGDDVDFCWRLQIRGLHIGVAPSAFVWHYRRSTVMAYFKQQAGYGRAEARLMKDHSRRFNLLSGGARWLGTVYEPAVSSVDETSRLYQGVFGNAPFQSIYSLPVSWFSATAAGFPWAMLALALLLAGIVSLPALIAGLAMISTTIWMGWKRVRHLPINPQYSSPKARALLWFLALAQPIVRGAARMLQCIKIFAIPRGPIFARKLFHRSRPPKWKTVGNLTLWNAAGKNRDDLLKNVARELGLHGWKHRSDDGWQDWDFETRQSFLWHVRITTVTEYHAGDNRLTRVRFASRMSAANKTLSALLLAGIITTCVQLEWDVLWIFGFGIYFLWWLLLELKHQSYSSSALQLVLRVAEAEGFEPTTEEKETATKFDDPA